MGKTPPVLIANVTQAKQLVTNNARLCTRVFLQEQGVTQLLPGINLEHLAAYLVAADRYLSAPKDHEHRAMQSFLQQQAVLTAGGDLEQLLGRLASIAANNAQLALLKQPVDAQAKYRQQRQIIDRLAVAEFLGHSVVYKIHNAEVAAEKQPRREAMLTFQTSCVINERTFEWKKIPYQNITEKPTKASDEVLSLYLFYERNPQALIDVHFVWVGTNNSGKVWADFERNPGTETYWRHERTIVQNCYRELAQLERKFSGSKLALHFSGHSLGGALAQLHLHSMMHVLLKHLVRHRQDNQQQAQLAALDATCNQELRASDNFVDFSSFREDYAIEQSLIPNSISELDVAVWNSPGILQPLAKHADSLANLLVSEQVKVGAYYGQVEGDSLQSAGQAKIGTSDTSRASLAMILVSRGAQNLAAGEQATSSPLLQGMSKGQQALTALQGAATNVVSVGSEWFYRSLAGTLAAHQSKHFMAGVQINAAVPTFNSNSLDLTRLGLPEGQADTESKNFTIYAADTRADLLKLREILRCHSVVMDHGVSMISHLFNRDARAQIVEANRRKLYPAQIAQILATGDEVAMWAELEAAIKRGCAADIDDWIRARPSLTDEACPNGYTMLHYVVKHEQWQLGVSKILPLGVNINAQVKGASIAGHGDTALHLFHGLYNPGTAGYRFAVSLLTAGARIDLPGHHGKSMAELHLEHGKSWKARLPSLRSGYDEYKNMMDERAGEAVLNAQMQADVRAAVVVAANVVAAVLPGVKP